MTQQLTIAASDHGKAALNQTDNAVAQGGGFPVLCTDALDAIDDVGDLAIGGAAPAPIGGLKHVPVAPPLLRRQPAVIGNGSSLQGAQEVVDRFDPVVAVGIKRHKRRERSVGRDASKTDQPNCVAIGVEEEMRALVVRERDCFAQLGEEVASRRQDVWHARE